MLEVFRILELTNENTRTTLSCCLIGTVFIKTQLLLSFAWDLHLGFGFSSSRSVDANAKVQFLLREIYSRIFHYYDETSRLSYQIIGLL